MPKNKKKTTPAGKILQGKNHKRTAELAEPDGDLRTYTIRDYRLEKPRFTSRQVRSDDGDGVRYEVESSDLDAPVPPIRDSKYLRREQLIELLRRDDTVTGFESQVYRRDGEVIWISENARAVYDAAGNLSYYEGSVEDVTKRKHLFSGWVELSSAGGAEGVETLGPLWNPSVERLAEAIDGQLR